MHTYLQRLRSVGASAFVRVAHGRPDVFVLRIGVQVELNGDAVGECLQAHAWSGDAVDVQVADDVLGEVLHFVEVRLTQAPRRVHGQDHIGRLSASWVTANVAY